MRLLLSWLPAVLLSAALLLLNCSSDRPSLVIWVGGAPDEVTYWESLIADFELDSGLEVHMVRQPTDSDQRRQGLAISLQSRQADPDLFLMDVVWIGQFVKSDWLEPLDLYLGEVEKEKPFFPRVLKVADRYDGNIYALPIYVDGGLLYYRKDLLEELGYAQPPTTWGELVAMSEAVLAGDLIENNNMQGFLWQGAQYEGLVCTFLEFISSNGGGIYENESFQIESEANREALQFMIDLIHHYKISPPRTFTEMKEEEVRSSFQRGNAVFERNWPYAWKLHQAEDSPVKGRVALAPLPHFPGHESASTLGGWHAGISRYSDVKDDAWKLLDFITSYDSQKKLALNLGWNPGRSDVYRDKEVLHELPHLSSLQEVFALAVARPNLPYYTQVSSVIQRYVNKSLSGSIDPEIALQKMQAEIEEMTRTYEE